ncbi:MAG: hypothetical protein JWO11_4460 [Nocardioides sp.]|nr:hypothetical protein [Nocardioides sp.]
MAAFCQVRELAETVSALDGMWHADPIEACRVEPVYEVHVEHRIGLRVALCTEHQQITASAHPRTRSVKLRDRVGT